MTHLQLQRVKAEAERFLARLKVCVNLSEGKLTFGYPER